MWRFPTRLSDPVDGAGGTTPARRLRRRRRVEHAGFAALDRGVHLVSTFDTTTRDLCLALPHAAGDACPLPATRTQEISRATPPRQPLAARTARDRAWIHKLRDILPRCAPLISPRGVRASRYPPAALTSPEEPGDAVFGSVATA